MFLDKLKKLVILFAAVSCFYTGSFTSLHANEGYAMQGNDDLITEAKRIAKENQIEADKMEVKLYTQDKFIVVDFSPRNDGRNIRGGGGRVFFVKENGKYKFHKIDFWK